MGEQLVVKAVLQIDGQTSRLLWESNQRKIKGVLIQWKRSVVLFSTTGDHVIESQCINTVQREQTGGVGGKEIANPMNTTILFLQQFSKELKLIFTRLSDSKLLKRCVKGHPQNANESLHHVIWHCWPKERFVGRNTVETANCTCCCIVQCWSQVCRSSTAVNRPWRRRSHPAGFGSQGQTLSVSCSF